MEACNIVKCPFNPKHVFTQDRLQSHILKCMKNYPNHVTCPYNALHRFLNKEDLLAHIFNCPSKMVVQPWRYVKMEKHGDLTEQPFYMENRARDEEEEDWESEYRR